MLPFEEPRHVLDVFFEFSSGCILRHFIHIFSWMKTLICHVCDNWTQKSRTLKNSGPDHKKWKCFTVGEDGGSWDQEDLHRIARGEWMSFQSSKCAKDFWQGPFGRSGTVRPWFRAQVFDVWREQVLCSRAGKKGDEGWVQIPESSNRFAGEADLKQTWGSQGGQIRPGTWGGHYRDR